uniref:Apyrase n=1 Tax=Neobodo designis TaxID=312471 RepID=A0A7S1QWB9_NEODS|mmetsp:Transcript_53627/g.164912  ORF Transcript_53627/g.164912 Transcript_53627/m.164912 type:complete len:482 (+) Transcript_53627:57-1502(+)
MRRVCRANPNLAAVGVRSMKATVDAIGSPSSVPRVQPPGVPPPTGAHPFPPHPGDVQAKLHHSSGGGAGAHYVGAAVRYYSNKAAAAWNARPARERRAVFFFLVFLVLVSLSVAQAVDTSAPAVAHAGILPNIGLQAGGVLFADVNQYAIVAVADNDGSPSSPTAPPPPTDGPDATEAKRRRGDPATAVIMGKLTFSPATKHWSVEWGGAPQWISAMFAVGGRGMELSTLQYWRDDKLYACDDRTGIVYELTVHEGSEPTAVPRFILPDGNGNVGRGMRCEWSTVKGDFLFLGSTGKARIDVRSRGVIDTNAMWVKSVSPLGEVRHMDWTLAYAKVRSVLGITNADGYAIHECAAWSRVHRSWVFVPRHVSNAAYTPEDENKHGSTVLVITDAAFRTARTVPLPPMRSSATPFGVTECKFVPNGRDDALVIVKAVTKADGTFESVVAMVSLDGRLIMDDAPMPAGFQFEALELRPMLHSAE